MPVHSPRLVIWQLRDRGVDILAATEDQTNELPDDELLRLATSLSRVHLISDLELIAKATDPDYWTNRVEQLPL